MKCRIDKSKLLVDNILRDYQQDEIDIMVLCDDEIENTQKVFKYLIELFSKINENSTDDYISKILIGIISYIEMCNSIKYEMTDEEKKDLNDFEQIYQEFLKNYNKECNEQIINNLEKINALLENNTLSENERLLLDKNLELKALVELLKGKVDALNVKVKLYEDKISKLEAKNNKLDQNNQELNKKIKELKEELKSLKKLYDNLLLDNNNLNQLIDNKNIDIESLKNKIAELDETNKKLNEQIISLENELEIVTNRLNEYQKIEETKTKEQELDNYILSKLFDGEYTLYNLYTILNDEGYFCTKEDISESLKRIKKYICIDNAGIPITYKASSPIVATNKNFVINNINNTYDLLITADWHLSTEIDMYRTLGYVTALYNYCEANNINLIVNLGDFLDVKPTDCRYDQYSNNMRLLENIITLFPNDRNIIHAILGGNHDRRMLKLGIDPIKYLADSRNDFINLGYDDATINFIQDNSSEFIGLHHPNIAGLQLDDFVAVREEINNYLKNTYKDVDFRRKDIFLDLFGHFHLPRIYAANYYAFVPALMKLNGQNTNGAFHLKIYFNENNTIDYIVIKSIIPDRSFECLGEHVYQKK